MPVIWLSLSREQAEAYSSSNVRVSLAIKRKGLLSKTTTLHVQFCTTSLYRLHSYDMKIPNFALTLIENANKQRRNFISLSELGYGPLEYNFSRVSLHLTK